MYREKQPMLRIHHLRKSGEFFPGECLPRLIDCIKQYQCTLHPQALSTILSIVYADLGLLDLLQLQDKLPGLLLYHVALGGFNGDTLLQDGTVSTILSAATGESYPLNFTIDPQDNRRVSDWGMTSFEEESLNVVGKVRVLLRAAAILFTKMPL